MTSDIQWYIARDGKQYGPLSDPEMGLFVKGGHLKPEDLVWRPGFSDWMPAETAFPRQPAPPAPRPSLAPVTAPAARTAAPNMAAPAPVAAAQAVPTQGTTAGRLAATVTAPTGGGQPAPDRGPMGTAAGPAAAGPMVTRTGSPAAGQRQTQPAPTAGAPAAAPAPSPGRADPGRAMVPADRGFDEDEHAEDEPRGTPVRKLLVAALLLAVLGGAGWLTYQKRESVKGFISSMVAGKTTITRGADPTAPAFIVEAGPADAIDQRLQRTALWSVVKREFPEWYGERLGEMARLTAEKKPDATVTRHLIEALVALRRKHANDALAASSPRLLTIADAFLANLKRIAEVSTTTCYSFISQGEASPAVIELVQKKGTDTDLQAQVTAIFEAIAEGRKAPVKHAAPDKTDYDALAEQLTKLGWSQADLQLFADPRALARTSHDRVCKMVQDWFSAHIAVKDRGAQERLLIETLRPVVAG